MVEKKGRPPPVKKCKNTINFTVFTADTVEKRGHPPGKNGKKRKNPGPIFTVFTADMVEKKGRSPR